MVKVKISSKNQITLPKQLLQLLRVDSGDFLFLEAEEEKVIVQPARQSVVESLVGSIKVKPNLRGVPFSQVLKETKKIVARKLK